MESIKIIEPDILNNIYDSKEEKSNWKIIYNNKTQQIFSKEVLFQKNFTIKEEDFSLFKNYSEEYKSINHKCLNPLKYIILPNKSRSVNGALLSDYQSINLKDQINNLNKNKLNQAGKFLIIYGIARFMEFLESKNKFHGRLNVSNIFLTEKLWPIITDPLIHHIFKKYEDDKKFFSIENLLCYPSEYYKENNLNIKTDVYSFGILIIQLFTENIDLIKSDYILSEEIVKGEKISFEFNLPEDIAFLILDCIQDRPYSRPNFKNIVETLEKINKENITFKSEEFEKYKYYLNKEEIDEVIIEKDLQIKKYKEEADKGKSLEMYLYGKAKYEGDKCTMDKKIGIKYLSSAAILKNKEAINYFQVIELEQKLNKSKENIVDENSFFFEDTSSHKSESSKSQENNLIKNENDNKLKLLYEDDFFEQEQKEEEIYKIIENVNNNYRKSYDDKIIEIIKSKKDNYKNFIFTENAIKRLCKLYNYLSLGIPVLLEGPTGTSKSLSVKIICDILGKNLIKFNLSSETTIPDLMGRYIGDEDSWGGITLKEGPYKTAAEKGYVLLLDEINLASENVLQSIEASIDCKEISIEIQGMPLKKIKINNNFCLVATQNPNKGLFVNKRQNLSQKFLNKFQPIYFPPFPKEELLQIAKGLSENFGYKGNESLINDLVDFHYEWSKKSEIIDDVKCFTIREIAATIDAISKGDNPYDTILTIYAARYNKELKKELIYTLNKKSSFIDSKNKNYSLPKTFPKCFHSKALLELMKFVQFSFKNKRNIILSGKEGNGLTQVSKWISTWYELEMNKSKNEDSYFSMITEETKMSDLIGKLVPVENPKTGQELIEWKPAFLLRAIELGKCAVLDGIDNAKSIVTERLNCLLDKTYGEGDEFFDVPENPKESQIIIHKNFRLLCTAKIDKINKMSPAFVNRFDIIVLEDQIENLTEKEFSQLILILMNQPNISLKLEELKEKTKEIIEIQKIEEPKKNTVKYVDYENENSEDEPKIGGIIDNKLFFGDEDDNEIDYEENKNEETKIEKEKNPGNFNIIREDFFFNDSDSEENKIKENKKEDKNEEKKGDFEAEKQLDNEIQEKITKIIIKLIYDKKIECKNIYRLSKLCRAIVILIKEIEISEKITEEDIVNLSYKLITNEQEIDISDEIQNKLIKKLNKENSNYIGDKYFFDKSSTLKNFIAFLVACSLINQHVCIIGPAGVGKTSGAKKFSCLRNNKSKTSFQMHTFHSGTKPNHFYGTTTLQDGKIKYINGTLTNSLIQGCTFIADELNLSPSTTMDSLSPALELYFNEPIYFPGINESIKINSSFFFIACQNDLNTIGRNIIPNTINSKLRFILYPKQSEMDIINICKEIKDNVFWNNDTIIDEADAENIGKFMLRYNEANIKELKPWSLRDITKLINRIKYQGKHPDDFKKIDPYLNVLFYCLSPLIKENFETVEKVSEIIFNLIVKCFKLKKEDEKRMKLCYTKKPVIERDSYGKTYIMKNDCGVNFKYFEKKLIKATELHSILESLFLISLSSEEEPIIIFGPSGYKTYISKLFLSRSKVISLNPESTISQLLGTSAFFVEKEVKIFYLNYLCKLCHGNEGKKIFKELNEKLINDNLGKNEIDKLIADFKGPECFEYAIKNLSKKLIEHSFIENCALSDIYLEFRPGLFFSSLIEGCPLILKNISNLPTTVLERFNELLSSQHSLTINEDIHNTFTSKDEKELSNFSDNFRIFGTSQVNEVNKLSDAILSRCSLIYACSYTNIEQENVIKNYIENNHLKFNEKNIKLFIDIITSLSTQVRFSFKQIINCIEICSRLNNRYDKLSDDLEKNIIGIVLYKIINGSLEKILTNKTRRIKQKEIINKVYKTVCIQREIHEMNPFEIKEEKGKKKLISKITLLELESHLCKNNLEFDKYLAFTDYFIDMLDVLHFGFCCHTPVIFEGKPGQGKQTAIKFIANYLGYDIINIMLSSTTKVDDLLGREKILKGSNDKIEIKFIKTKFSKALTHNNNKERKQIIVLHNINKCSPALFDVLISIFDLHEHKILYKNGEIEEVKESFIVGIFYGDNGKYKLPHSLVSSVIYHIIPNQSDTDIKNIIRTRFNFEKLNSDIEIFENNFIKAKKIALEHNSSFPLTLNDIEKYIEFRKVTGEYFDKDIISYLIFAYRFLEPDITKEVLKAINLSELNFVPYFNYTLDKKNLIIKISENSNKELLLKTYDTNIDKNEINTILNCLTDSQMRCLFFLCLCFKTKIIPIIQGETVTGKTFIIRLFSKILGQKLNIYQMNKDTGLSIFVGQSILSSTLEKGDEISFKKIFSNFESFPKIKEYLIKNFENCDAKKWTPQQFSNLLELINDHIKNNNDNDTSKLDLLINGHKKIKEICLPVNRFKPSNSVIIDSLEKGSWVLFDGIESAPEEISEKCSSLSGKLGNLDLYDLGINKSFSRKLNNIQNLSEDIEEKLINDNFFLIVSYNPTTQSETNILDLSFMNKGITFTLPPIDIDHSSRCKVISGSLLSSNFNNLISYQYALRISKVHQFMKDKSEKERDTFSSDLKFTGRNMLFICKQINKYQKNKKYTKEMHIPIIKAFNNFYANSLNANIEEDIIRFKEKMVNKFTEKINSEDYINFNSHNSDKRGIYKPLLSILREIQNSLVKKTEYVFSFKKFLDYLGLVKLQDIELINSYIEQTILLIRNFDKNDLNNYYLLIIPSNILKNIIMNLGYVKDQQKSNNLLSLELLKIDELSQILTKLHFLSKISEFEDYFSLRIPIFLTERFLGIMTLISNFVERDNLNSLTELIKIMHKNKESIDIIDKFFPYYNFINFITKKKYSQLICHFLPLVSKLNKSKNNFYIIIDDKIYDFKYNENIDFIPTFSFKDSNTILFGVGTKFQFGDITNLIKKEKDKRLFEYPYEENIDHYTYNLMFYYLADKCLCEKIKEKKELRKYMNIFKEEQNKINSKVKDDKIYINNFYPKDNGATIAKIWNLLYFIQDKKVLRILKNILNKIEQKILDDVKILFDEIKFNEIDSYISFTRKMVNFCRRNSMLWKIILKQNLFEKKETIEEAFEIKKKIEEEKYNVLNISCLNNWKNSYYISFLDDGMKFIENKINKLKNDELKINIENKINNLINNLKKANIDEENSIKIKDSLIKKFKNIQRTEKNYQECENELKEFLANLSFSEQDNKEMIWPSYIPTFKHDYKINDIYSKFFNCLLWYSEMTFLLKNYFDSNINENPYYIYNKLISNGLKIIADYLINKPTNRIISEEIQKLFSMIKMHFLNKLIENDCYDKIFIMKKLFNKIKKRNLLNEEDYNWIFDVSKKYSIDFPIIFPVFDNPNDLIFLFLSITENTSIYGEGPMKIGERDKELMAELIADFGNKSNMECANKIAKAIYHVYINKTENLFNNNKELELFFEDKIKEYGEKNEKSEIIKKCIFILKIGEDISRKEDVELKFDDIGFLNDKIWEFNDKLKKKYPSLIYWLIKNRKSYLKLISDKTLVEWYNKVENKEKIEYIPFFVLCLRLMSSLNCLHFQLINLISPKEYQNNKQVLISNEIYKNIKNRTKENMTIKWINIMLINIPWPIYDENYRLLYNYLNYIIDDSNNLDDFPKNIKENMINEFIIKIIKIVMDEKVKEELIKVFDINDKKCDILYLFDPAQMIFETIISKKKEILSNCINSEEFLKITNQINALINDEIPKDINNLNKGIINDINNYQDILDMEYEKEKTKYLDILIEKIDKYSFYINDIETEVEINENYTYFEYMKKIKEYLEEMDKILEDKKYKDIYESLYVNKNPIEICAFCFISYSNLDYYEIIEKKTKKVVQKENGGLKEAKIIIFSNKFFDIKFVKNEENPNSTIITTIEKYNKIYYRLDKNKLNKEKIFSKILKKPSLSIDFEIDNNKNIPTKNAVGSIITLSECIKKTISSLLHHIHNYGFENCYSNFYSIISQIHKFNPKIFYSYENSETKAKNALDELFENYKNLDKYIKELKKIIENPIKIYEETKSLSESKYIFSNIVKVKIPKITNLKEKISLRSIKNHNSLVSPLISFDEYTKKLICSVNEINISFKPIIGQLYIDSNYSILLISSLDDKNLELKIDFEKDFYQRYFSKKINNDSVEIIIKVPETDGYEEKNIEIKGNFKFISEKYSELLIPFTLSFQILPLQILFHCKEYLIAFKDGKYFLCVDKIISNTFLHFSCKYFNIKERVIQNMNIISLEGNEVPDIPEIINNDPENIEVKIIGTDKPTKLKCIVNFAFSKNLIVPLYINAVVIPFYFAFEVYDFSQKKFKGSCNIFFANKKKTLNFEPISIKFRIHLSEVFNNQIFTGIILHNNFPDYINILNEEKIMNKELLIKNHYEFTIQILFNHKENVEKNKKCIFSLFINDYLKKDLIINFIYKGLDDSKDIKEKFVVRFCDNIFYSPFDYINIDEVYYKEYTNLNIRKKEINYIYGYINSENNFNTYSLNSDNYYIGINFSDFYQFLDYKSSTQKFIILYYDAKTNFWAPYTTIYPEEFNNLKKIEPNVIKEMKKKELDEISKEKKNFIINCSKKKNKKDFKYLLSKLFIEIKDIDITDLIRMINCFPKIIQNRLKKELIKFNEYKWLNFYNFIIELYHIFKERNKYLLNFPLNAEVESIVINKNKEFYTIKENKNEISEEISRLNKLDEYCKKIMLKNKYNDLENKYEAMLLNEKDFIAKKPLEKKSKNDCPIYKEIETENIMKNTNNENLMGKTIKELENIEIPKEISIRNLLEFYSKCIENTKIIPLVIRDIILSGKDEKNDFDIIDDNYNKLMNLYNFIISPESKYEVKEKSILSLKASQFLNNFELMIKKLKNAEPNLNFGVNIKLSLKIHDFIRSPKLDDFNLGDNFFKGKNFLRRNSTYLNNDKIKNLSNRRENQLKKLEEEKRKKEKKKRKEIIENENKIIIENNIKSIKEDKQIDLNLLEKSKDKNEIKEQVKRNFEYLKESESEEEEEEIELSFKNKESIKLNQNKIKNEIQKEKIKLKGLNNGINKKKLIELFDKNFNEKEGIERTTERLEKLSEEEEFLNIKYGQTKILEPDLLKPNKTNLAIKELYEKSLFITSYIIKEASEYEIPYENICVNILIDCSIYINDLNKIYNLISIFGLIESLFELKIPYSVTVISDEKFRTVIKDFHEPHSIEIAQRIRDCVMIQRFKSNYASNLKFALDNLKFNNKNREQRAFFLFSDGLNENLKLAKNWAELLLNNENNSFGFIFIKSNNLTKPNIWENLWKNFDSKVKERGALSFTKIFIYEENDLLIDRIKLIDYTQCICKVLNRKKEFQKDIGSQINLKHCFKIEEDYIKLDENTLFNYEKNCQNKDYNKLREIYLKNNKEKDQLQNISKGFDEKISREHLGNILSICIKDEKIKKKLKELVKIYLKNKRKINLINLESIYKPNKTSQYVLSSTGTDFDITALVLNIINPVPEPLIYLEEKGGLMRNYRISIILDTSISCLNELSFLHTFQTLNYLLCSCSCLDLPCFDFIVARKNNPILLCSEVGTLNALNEKSNIWATLFTLLKNPVNNCNLSSAIKLSYDLRKIRNTEKGSFIYILTDGLYQYLERKEIIKSINDCEQNGINVIGIGIGIYPKGIEKLFTNSIYCREPSTLIKGLSYFFGEEISFLDYMPDLLIEPANSNIMEEIIKQIKNAPTDFESLKNYLQSIPPELDAMQDIYNSEKDLRDEKGGFHNIPEGKNTQIYIQNCLKGHKILFVMLYEEKDDITVQRVSQSGSTNSRCIKDAADYFGVSIKIVTNYKDAIKEILKQTKPGYCDYYSVWVLSSKGESKLQEKDPKNALKFVKILEKFWKNGGSLVLFVDNKPFTYEVNLFLEEVTFPNGQKVHFKMDGYHKGRQILKADPSGKLDKIQTFNRSPLKFQECERSSLAHNLGLIFEGVTIAYCTNEKEMSPFIPFAKDSNGGVTILYYCAENKYGTGDIILDGGYTKLFVNMTEEGTFKYIQNIIGWTARPEVHIIVDKISLKDWRPKAVNN